MASGEARGNDTISATIDSTGAKLIAVFVGRYGQGTGVTDNFGNTYIPAGGSTSSIGAWGEMYYAINARTGPGHIVSYNGISTSNANIQVAAFSWSGDFQVFASGPGVGTGVTTSAAGTITPTSARTLLLTGISNYGPDIVSVDSGFKMISESPYNAGLPSAGGALAYKITEETTAQSPIWTLGAGGYGGPAQMMSFNMVTPSDDIPTDPIATEHWVFNDFSETTYPSGVYPSGYGFAGRHASAATSMSQTIINGKTIVLPGGLPGVLNGLLTAFMDSADFTLCLVIRRPAGSPEEIIAGTQSPAILRGGTIGGYAAQPDKLAIVTDGLNTTYSPYTAANVAVGDWCFVAMRSRAMYMGGYIGSGNLVEETVGPKPANGDNIAIGNAYFNHVNYDNQLEVAEALYFNSALNLSQLTEAYARSKHRMSLLGIGLANGLPNLPATLLLAATSKGTSSSGGTSDPIDTTGANLLVANLAYYNSGILSSFIDNFGNSWIPLSAHVDVVTGAVQQMFYAENPIVGPGHTFSVAGTTIYASMNIAAFNGTLVTGTLDQEAGTSGSGSSILIGPVNQTTPLSLVVAAAAFSDIAGGSSIDSGFTLAGFNQYIFGAYFGSALAFKVSDSPVIHSTNLDLAAPMSGIAAGIATFKRP